MGILMIANSTAEARGQAPPVIPLADGVSRYDYYQTLPFIDPVNGGGQDFYRAPGIPDRPSEFPIAFTVRAFDKEMAENLTGLHGEIQRQANRIPVGVMEPFGGAYRSVVRPIPTAWDSGYWNGPAPATGF